MKISGQRVGRFLASPDPAVAAVLVYGPDSGLVSERAGALVGAVAGSTQDPFRVAELSAAALKSDPARLADEAGALSLVGGRRAVRVSGATDAMAPLFAELLKEPKGDSLVVVEAGALGARSALRRLFESAPRGAALACYGDQADSIERLVADSLAQHGLTASPEARAYLVERLGSDRLVSRAELAKLVLYMGGPGVVSLDDAMACVGDNAAASVDGVVYAAASGDQRGLDRALTRALHEGNQPVMLVRAAMRHFQRLHFVAGMIARGKSPGEAMAALKPPIIFLHARQFEAQVRAWPMDRLSLALTLLTEAEIDCKTTAYPAELIAGRAFMRLAQAGRARSRA